jgi:hypothetical protein
MSGVFLVVGLGCGRTPMLPPSCLIDVEPRTLDFSEVAPGQSATRSLRVANNGGGDCNLASMGMSPDSDPWFSMASTTALSPVLQAGEAFAVDLVFAPRSVSVPLLRTATLVLRLGEPDAGSVVVPLSGRIQSNCTIDVSPTRLDFGHVALDSTATQSVTLVNTGTDTCEIGGIALSPQSDPQFSLAPASATAITLAPGEGQAVVVSFLAEDASIPHHRAGTLGVETTDPHHAQIAVPLSADVDIGCDLTWTPTSLDFGRVNLNTRAGVSVALGNDGSDVCYVSGIGIDPASDPGFTLQAGQAQSLVVAPGTMSKIAVSFTADSSSPHQRSGTLTFTTGNRRKPEARIPISALVDTACIDASLWIYTVDSAGGLARFDPATLTFTDIATLKCPTISLPNSMAVDQNAVAWVAYSDGQLFKVDVGTGRCEATGFKTDQDGILVFGMGFVFDPATNEDTLYIAGGHDTGASQSTLATVSFPSLVVNPVGTVTAGFPEMTGTGDGALWGFIPADSSLSRVAALVRLDRRSGATLESYRYPSLLMQDSWAMKFWGGSFWIFIGRAIYEVSRDTPGTIRTAIANTGRPSIVGAGVSTCAPLRAPL